jgi:hypothetical protein
LKWRRSLNTGLKKAALPYMGNIIGEVCPIMGNSRLLSAFREVNMISMHQPTIPHFMKFLNKTKKGKG